MNSLLSPFSPSRTVRDLSAMRPCFLISRCRTLVRTTSPIRVQAWEIANRVIFPPLARSVAIEDCRYHPASNGNGVTDAVALPLSGHNPFVDRRWLARTLRQAAQSEGIRLRSQTHPGASGSVCRDRQTVANQLPQCGFRENAALSLHIRGAASGASTTEWPRGSFFRRTPRR